jgi:hypothetical protein
MSFVPKTPRRLQAHTHRGAANCPAHPSISPLSPSHPNTTHSRPIPPTSAPPIPAFLPYPHLIPTRRIPIPIPTTAPPIPSFLPYPHLIPIRRIPRPLRGSAARVVTSRFGRLTIIQLLNQTNQRTNQLRNKPNTRPNVPDQALNSIHLHAGRADAETAHHLLLLLSSSLSARPSERCVDF